VEEKKERPRLKYIQKLIWVMGYARMGFICINKKESR